MTDKFFERCSMPFRLHNLLLMFLLLADLTTEVVHGQLQPAERTALGAIFGEVQAIEAAVPIVQKTQQLTAEDRYRLLEKWGLPGEDHAALRLCVGFSTTGVPDQLATADQKSGHARQLVGGNITSPAAELVRVAAQLGRLAEVRHRMERSPSDTEDRAITRLAGLVMVDCASGNTKTAKDQLGANLRNRVCSSANSIRLARAVAACGPGRFQQRGDRISSSRRGILRRSYGDQQHRLQ
jgi:hypothetical protein